MSSNSAVDYVYGLLVGETVEILSSAGELHCGILLAVSREGVACKYVRRKDQDDEYCEHPSADAVVFPWENVLHLIARNVRDKMADMRFGTDSEIAQHHDALVGRELRHAAEWTGNQAGDDLESLGPDDGKPWDQFRVNEQQFGVKSTYREELYNSVLNKGDFSKSQIAEVERIARAISSDSNTSESCGDFGEA
jgi:hypothetical protein